MCFENFYVKPNTLQGVTPHIVTFFLYIANIRTN